MRELTPSAHTESRLDTKNYKKGKKTSKDEFDNLSLEFKNKFPLWNYTIKPFE